MRKIDADRLKKKFDSPHDYQDALRHFSRHDLNKFLLLLDSIEAELNSVITDYALDLSHDLLDSETPQIVRTFWFSKGMRDYYLCIDGSGLIRTLDPQMPNSLFDQIATVLDSFYE